MILMAPCIIDFIRANALLGLVGGRGPWTLPGPQMAASEASAIWAQKSSHNILEIDNKL